MTLHPEQDSRRILELDRQLLDPTRHALHENRDWYRDLIEHSQDLLCVHDLEGRLLSVNGPPARLLGYSVEEILQIPMRELIAPEYRQDFEGYLERLKSTGEARGLLVAVARSGERRIWEYSNTLRSDGRGNPIVSGIARDVTEQKRAEKLAREANELNRQIIASASEGVVVYDRNLRCVAWNPFMEKMTGITAGQAIGRLYGELIPPELMGHEPEAELKRALLGQTITVPDEKLWFSEGGEKWVSSRKGPLRDAEGGITGVIVTLQDITERKETEAKLRASENCYRALHESSPVGVCWVETSTGRFLGVNPKYCEIAGRTKADLLRRDFQSITHPDDLPVNLEKWRHLVQGTTRHYEMDKRYVRPDDSIRWVEAKIVAMWPESGKPDWHMAIVEDITERRQAEERLREYGRVLEGLDEMIVVVDRDHRFVIANRAYLNYRTMKKEQVIGRRVDEILYPEAYAIVKPKLDECFRGKVVQFEMKYTYPKLGERDLFVSYFPIEGPTGVDRIACVFQDVTERKCADQALRDSKGFSENLIRTANVMIIGLDADGNITLFNEAAEKITGYQLSELKDKNWSTLAPRDRFPHMWEEFDRLAAGMAGEIYESPIITKTGEERYITWRSSRAKVDDTVAATFLFGNDITEQKRAEDKLRQTIVQLQGVFDELRQAKEKLAEEKLYLEESIDSELGFGEIVGRSSALKQVMEKVAKVAPSDATVLLLGETGTGKELVARALHHGSRRQGESFIKMNCAAIPSGLLESELFGHEKGAFTGAIQRKLGRLELADGGTLFLDEIGEIPLSLQPKLLRALQDMEFERLGSTHTLKVNFRLLAATNRDLVQSVKANEFRSDLYYRLNVFPILIPPLRERREDIRPLVEHFVHKFSGQMKKSITSIPSKTMELLVRWAWPGNIRELENFVERSVILTSGSVLQAPVAELEIDAVTPEKAIPAADNERERIRRALRDCHGKLGGPDGAAARLGLKRTTLQSRLDHLGIKPSAFRR